MLTALQHLRTSHIYSTHLATTIRLSRPTTIYTCQHLYSRAPRHYSTLQTPGPRPQLHHNLIKHAKLASASDNSETDTLLDPGLYLVGTPIGNLEDLSVRALKVLQKATVILAEDTRHSRKLLNYYNISSRLYSFHQHNEHTKQAQVIVWGFNDPSCVARRPQDCN